MNTRDVVRTAVIAWLGYGILFTVVTFAFLDLSPSATSTGEGLVGFAAVVTGLLSERYGRSDTDTDTDTEQPPASSPR